MNSPLGDANPFAGLWGSLVAHYWRQWLGGFGAWLVCVLAASALTVATLAWNPIRALVGRSETAPTPGPTATLGLLRCSASFSPTPSP